jgi:hypothetical protein
MFTESSLDFLSTLFHGIDFRKIRAPSMRRCGIS